ncbi:MAG TPA: hypothetical protein VE397_09640 [Stellaceae bacterium]|nr:hypothetical protein [Stellaceae bacterium]
MTLLTDIARLTLWFLPVAGAPPAPWQGLARNLAEEEIRYAAQHGFMRAPDGSWKSAPPPEQR